VRDCPGVVMSVLDRHVLIEWLKIFALVLMAMLGLLVLEDMSHNFSDFIDYKSSSIEVIYYYLVIIPGKLPIVLPLSILISLLYALGQLHRSNEFTAMRAAGIGTFRITRTIWCVGVLLTAGSWFLGANIIPWSVEHARRIKDNLAYQSEARRVAIDRVGVQPVLAFDNQRQGRLWMMNRFSAYSNRGYGVTLSELDSKRREVTRIVAREAYFDDVRGVWVFLWGRELWFDPDEGEQLHATPFDEKSYPHIVDDPALMLLLGKKADDLSISELRTIIDYYTIDENPKVVRFAVQYERLLAAPLGMLIVIGLAIPFAMSGVRVNPAVGVSKSIGLFFLYYLLSNIGSLLGERQTIDPVVAAWLPNAAMIGLSLILFWRMR
jgi:LPS export ABC transporter permease LptG